MEDFLDKVYANNSDDTRIHYPKWSKTYDHEFSKKSYVTPARTAKALASNVKEMTTLVLDYGCVNGLSRVALREIGLNTVDGIDVSKETVAFPNNKKAYQTLRVFDPNACPPIKTGEIDIIAAIVVNRICAACVSVFDTIIILLVRGGIFAFSFNDHALADPAVETKVSDYVDTRKAKLILSEYSDHMPRAGLKSNIYILEIS